MSHSDYVSLHQLAQFFAVRGGLKDIVLLTDNYEGAIKHYPPNAIIYVLKTGKAGIPNHKLNTLPPNVASLPLKHATPEFLKDKVLVCVEYLENQRLREKLIQYRKLQNIIVNSGLSICAVKETRYWNINRLKKLMKDNKTALLGRYGAKQELLGISGRLANVRISKYPLLPVLAIITQYNEEDIIEPVIRHLLDQNVDVHVIDNWSDDGSYDAVRQLASQHPSRISYERFPEKNNHKFELSNLLKRVAEVATDRPEYKWIISNDADEIRWSPWLGVNIQEAISFIDYQGFNCIDYTVFNFHPTKDGFKKGVDPLKFFKYGEFGAEGWHFMQLKAWRNDPLAEMASTGGHLVALPNLKIFPIKFLMGHYSLRSNEHARKKIFKERKPRFAEAERKRGWHSHYNNIKSTQSFIRSKKGLIPLYRPDTFDDYLLERVSGIGIKIKE